MARFMIILAVILILAVAARPQDEKAGQKPLISDYFHATVGAPPSSLGLDPFYKKYTDALGISIVSSEKVPDAALLVARDIAIHMLAKRPDLRAEMERRRCG